MEFGFSCGRVISYKNYDMIIMSIFGSRFRILKVISNYQNAHGTSEFCIICILSQNPAPRPPLITALHHTDTTQGHDNPPTALCLL